MTSLPLDALSHLSPPEPTANVPPRVDEPIGTGSFQEHLDEPQARSDDVAVSTAESPQSGAPDAGEETEQPAEQPSSNESEAGEKDEARDSNEAQSVEQPAKRHGAPVTLPVETLEGVPASVDGNAPTSTAAAADEVLVQVEQLGERSNLLEQPVEIRSSAERVLQDSSEVNDAQAVPAPRKNAAKPTSVQPAEQPSSQSPIGQQAALAVAEEVVAAKREQIATTSTSSATDKVSPATLEEDVLTTEPLPTSSDELGTASAARRQTAYAAQAKTPVETESVTSEDARGASSESSAAHAIEGTRSQRAGLTLLRGETNATESSGSPQQTRFVQRVTKAFEVAQQRGEPIRLRLHPPELGSLRLEVKVEGNVMLARIETETQSARTLLIDNLPVLRERLAEQNIRVEQFDIDLLDRHASAQEDQRDQPNDGEPTDESSDSPDEQQTHSPVPRPHGPSTGESGDSNLDVRI